MASYFKRVAKLSKNVSLAELSGLIQLPKNARAKVKPVVNHVICIDVSGSMYDVLPHIRTQLKSKLVDIVGDKDTVSIIKFDNRGSIVSEMVQISKANDVREMNKLIDKELVAGGCTNFLDPISLSNRLVTQMNSNDGLWNLFFMSDGGHNTGGSWDEIIALMNSLRPKISNATICEYGYWADSERLTLMAETLGGQKIFDKDFEEYDSDFEKVMKTKSVKRVKLDISEVKKSMRLQFMFTLKDGIVNVYSTEKTDLIFIPEDTQFIYYLQKNEGEDASDTMDMIQKQASYAAINILADKFKYDLVDEILYGLKDKEMIDLYSHSYGKQKIEEFKNAIMKRASGETECVEFIKSKYTPNAKKYCLFDFISDLTSNENNLVHLTHPDFNYNFISAKSMAKVELTEEDKDKLSKASTKIKAEKILTEASKYQVTMRYEDDKAGCPVSSLSWNNERANVSFKVKIPVILTVPEKSNPSKTFEVKSYVFRNFALVRDGILNQDELIVTLADNALAGKFKRMGLVVKSYDTKGMYKLNLSKLPIMNKVRMDLATAKTLSTLEYNLLECKAAIKYISYLKKGVGKKSTEGKSERENYLESLGIVNGEPYTPKTEIVKSNDFYMALYLETKIEKFSNLPKIEDVLRKRELGKSMTVSEAYMDYIMSHIEDELKVNSLENLAESYKEYHKEVITDISQIKFAIIVSRMWFPDLNGFDDDTVKVNINGNELNMKFVFSEKKVDL